ncbi:MAG TPA: CDP-alcohol phosphatidyltransferase family protein [Candidatus Krumholzibacteriaceae bacterium]|nr:CDP-alcohol phosphatidyltransferase family protein [Candidatus Krumholzibacteriaceae bacterium]
MSVKTEIKNFFRRLIKPLVSFISLMGVSPLTITSAGIIISLFGAFLVAGGRLFAGGVALALSGLCDMIDGSLARQGEKVTVFGAFLDSTGDRVAELAYFGALIFYYVGKVPVSSFYIILVIIAMSGSLLTSYARARAEGLGVSCEIGFLERPERIILLIAGLIFGGVALVTVIAVLAFLTVFTFIQRVVHVGKLTMGKDL